MENEIRTWMLGIGAALFSGLNIFQFLFYKSTKKKHEAEAEEQVIENQKKRQDIRHESYGALIKQGDDLFKQVMDLQAITTKALTDVAFYKAKVTALEEENKRLVAENKILSDELEHVKNDRDNYRDKASHLEATLKNYSYEKIQ